MAPNAEPVETNTVRSASPAAADWRRWPFTGHTGTLLLVVAFLAAMSFLELLRPNPPMVDLLNRSHPGNLRLLIVFNAEGWRGSGGSGWSQTRGYALFPDSFPWGDIYFVSAGSQSSPALSSFPLLLWFLFGFLGYLVGRAIPETAEWLTSERDEAAWLRSSGP